MSVTLGPTVETGTARGTPDMKGHASMPGAVPSIDSTAGPQHGIKSTTEPSDSLVPQSLLSLFDRNNETVTSALARDPSQAVADVVKRLHGAKPHHVGKRPSKEPGEELDQEDGLGSDGSVRGKPIDGIVDKLVDIVKIGPGASKLNASARNSAGKAKEAREPQLPAMRPPTAEELVLAQQAGDWQGGDPPDELFLQMLTYAIQPMRTHPLAGMVSPPLMASMGSLPLTILSVIPDIIQHHADVIVRAQHEVFLATNFWEASGNANMITDAFKELSRRVISEGRPQVVVKVMYDRGSPKQALHPHLKVEAKEYTGEKVKLPSPEEIPGVSLETVNYHDPPVGTFHSKYCVIDRQIALINSNNIQDRVNVEFMVHVEGPIVQGFYDMALVSWHLMLDPPLPLLTPGFKASGAASFGHDHPVLREKDVSGAAARSKRILDEHNQTTETGGVEKEKDGTTFDRTDNDEVQRVDGSLATDAEITKHLNTGTKISGTAPMTANDLPFMPLVMHEAHKPFPIALVNRPPHGRPGHGDRFNPQDQAWLAGFKFAKRRVLIQTPTFNAKPVVQAAIEAVRRGIEVEIMADLGFNDEGELLPFQGGTNSAVSQRMYSMLSDEEKPRLKIYWYTGKDQDKPLNAKDKSRNCHVKLMIVDDHVGIVGNGNQDTQSWFHSQEINIMLQSAAICKDWMHVLRSNQNTLQRGLVGEDGIWRDSEGNRLATTEDPKPPKFGALAGVKGAIQRVRGEGGF